jgi:hypothetical protein
MENVFVKKPLKINNYGSVTVALPVKITREFGISAETPIQISVESGRIIISRYCGKIEGVF